MIKKGDLYYPTKEFRKAAQLNDESVYDKAAENPIKFWEDLAERGIVWRKTWTKAFVHRPPHFQWFVGGKLNITESCFNRHLPALKDKVALIWEPEPLNEKPRRLTYRELFSEVGRFANVLKKLGVKKGDRVGIYLPMIPEVIMAMLACARIGAIHCVVFSAFSPQALKVRLQDTRARILITADGYYRRGQAINLKAAADVALAETQVKKVIVVKRVGNKVAWQKGRDFWWSDLVKKEKSACLPAIMESEDPLFILYTSGSTGKPKGCVHTNGGYAVQSLWTGKWIFDWRKTDIFWCTADVGWVTGHTYGVYSPLLNGVTSLMFEGAPDFPEPDRWCQIIEKYRVTILYTAPTAIRMFAKYGEDFVKKHDLTSLRLLGSVGEPIDETAWLWYSQNVGKSKCPIVDTWWQTETGGILITSLPGLGPFKPGFTGRPFPGIKTDILDDRGKSCPVNEKGNLVIRPPFSPGFFRGIYKNPKKYRETYWSQYGSKIYFTSDGALRDKRGLIRIIGRVDDVIKVAGHRLSTGELENAVNQHPSVAECAVVGIPDKIKGEVPVIFVVLGKPQPEEKIKPEIINQIKKEIGPIALPKEIYLVEDLPKTRSGKIMRRILKRFFTGEELGDFSTLSNPEIVEKIKKIIVR
ncbi:MAG: acetate--CoA ligase [Candidatus Wildermuthbacteria bacterium GWA2_46_15]|uniref:Acetate--CoA ligase n=1 Tax=Candidatus Wildermuthbacteria bacterium GWA2_46_15 TaxID=1802443 RepID=A0A1G2QMU6_9BACT|nr:MAG: acetate--CoA ligase [Candidatus Wildermuthbacteria bacterium GWA2_46_15]